MTTNWRCKMNLYLNFTVFGTGEICPASGTWQSVDSKTLINISKGELFPYHDGDIARWKHKESFEPDPKLMEQLLEAS